MRSSQLAVLAALGLVLAVMLALVGWARIGAEPFPELSGEKTSRTYDYTGFDSVDIGGLIWQVTIERGDAWRVAVDMPAELVDALEPELDGDRLSLDFNRGWSTGNFREGFVVEATLTMPALAALDVSGASKVSFSGFDGASLSLDLSGASEIRGAASRFDELLLDMSGATRVELGDVPVTDAEVDASGSSNITLRMAGGRLTGDMSGVTNLEYFGTVSEESIERSGFVNIRRRD